MPSVRAILATAQERGWAAEAIFPEHARSRDWFAELKRQGLTIRVAPTGTRKSLGRSGTRKSLGRWLTELVAEGDTSGSLVLHTHFTAFDIPALVAARSRGRTGVIWHIHTNDARLRGRLRSGAKFAILGSRVDRILTPAESLVERIARWAPRARVEAVSNALDESRFPLASTEDRERARAEFGLSRDAKVILHFGWNWELKGGELFSGR